MFTRDDVVKILDFGIAKSTSEMTDVLRSFDTAAGMVLGTPGYQTFRGLLHLSVPFSDLTEHEEKQRRFLRWAGDDPVLCRVPLLFVFEPDPVLAP
jgi:hypothetical protein